MRWQELLKDYLTFSRKERVALLAIVFITVIVALLPKILSPFYFSHKPESDTSWINKVKSLEIRDSQRSSYLDSPENENENEYQYDLSVSQTPAPESKLFYFDPNTLPSGEWKRLGLKQKNIQTIQNYLSKGGHFYKPEDLQKIYGLSKKDYERIAPYIRINKAEGIKEEKKTTELSTKNTGYKEQRKINNLTVIDINTADTASFIALPGIGSKLAARIVYFRDKLGGFYSVDQIAETYGLPDSTFQKIKFYLKSENPSLRKININTATIDELKAHPYIKWSIANPIVAYRKEHGAYSNLEDIKKIPSVTEDLFNKLVHYLTIE